MAQVLITTDYLVPGDAVDRLLRWEGHETVFNPYVGPRTAEERETLLHGFDAAILASEPITAEMIRTADRLKIMARSGVGYDSIDISAAAAKGVAVCNAPGTNHYSVAELTIGMMIVSARRLVEVTNGVRDGGWPRQAGGELHGSVLGVIGYGFSGRLVAKLGAALGMKVLVSTSHPDVTDHDVQFVDLDEVLRRSDYLSLHQKADSNSPPLLDATTLRAMKPTATVINTSRGSLIDEAALAHALRSGTIAAAALDVLSTEPLPPESPLRGLNNVIITSHLAGQTVQARLRAGEAAAQAVVDLLRGREPAHRVPSPSSKGTES
ncbi:phosphoglycerate dehydrogenase [Nesterenkonia sp. CF4.4]|uniref:phosphoglycerate dehydrogenase n=1 Tax=Nesterenkonia sp. CF4.4 TaxID=3373079 RepID=UPI003EE4FEBF